MNYFKDLRDFILEYSVYVAFILLTIWGILELLTRYNVIGGIVQ